MVTWTAASTAQNPIGNQNDIDWARKYVEEKVGSGRVIHVALRISPEQVDTLMTRILKLRAMPWNWILDILCFPCLLGAFFNSRKSLGYLFYIVTNREILKVFQPHSAACCLKPTGGPSCIYPINKNFPLGSIGSCNIDNGQGYCDEFTPIPAPRIKTIDEIQSETRGNTDMIPNLFYVTDPDQFVSLVNELRELDRIGSSVGHQSMTHMSPPPAYGASSFDPIFMSGGIRIFVALATNPSKFEILPNFQYQQGLDGLSQLVAEAFGQQGVKYTFTLAEIDANISNTSAIQANDKIIATKTV